MNEIKVCCFTGHRDLPAVQEEKIIEKARALLTRLIDEGVTEFRVGGAVGFDMIMAELLLKLRDEERKAIRVVSVIPYPSWKAKWTAEEKERQEEILQRSDRVIYVRQHYCRGIYMIRNRALVNGAQYCIAWCTRGTGGSTFTVRYAGMNGAEVFNLADEVR